MNNILNVLFEENEWSTVGDAFWLEGNDDFRVGIGPICASAVNRYDGTVPNDPTTRFWDARKTYYYQLENAQYGWLSAKVQTLVEGGDENIYNSWQPYTPKIDVPANTKIYLKCPGGINAGIADDPIITAPLGFWIAATNDNVKLSAGGNINSFVKLSKSRGCQCLFYHCDKLVDASQINWNQISPSMGCDHVLDHMFYNCSSLSTVSLPAIIRNNNCNARNMFYNCYNLKNVLMNDANQTLEPFLLCNQGGNNAYDHMFYNCNALTSLPATFSLYVENLGNYTFKGMFEHCDNIINANAVLHGLQTYGNKTFDFYASGIVGTFESTFENCTKLKTELLNTVCTPFFNSNVGSRTFFKTYAGCTALTSAPSFSTPGDKSVRVGPSGYYQTYKGCTSIDGTAVDYKFIDLLSAILDYGLFLIFKDCTNLKRTYNGEWSIGNVGKYSFASMFNGCTSLTSIPSKIAISTLKKGTLQDMFKGCSSLKTAPRIEFNTLDSYSCSAMFSKCTSLTSVPSSIVNSNVTNFSDHCFASMFADCSSLISIPRYMLGTRNMQSNATLNNGCYVCMFSGCTSLPYTPYLPAITLAPYCYDRMFLNCSSLIAASELPGTPLKERCYREMFKNCKSLSSLKVGFTQFRGDLNATTDWVNGISTSGIFIKPDALTVPTRGNETIPASWIISPEPYVAGANQEMDRIRSFYDNDTQRNIIVMDIQTLQKPSTLVKNLYVYPSGNTNILYRLEQGVTFTSGTSDRSWKITAASGEVGLEASLLSSDQNLGLPYLPSGYTGLDDIDRLKAKWYSSGYTSFKLTNKVKWKKKWSGSDFSTNTYVRSYDPVILRFQVQGYKNSTWSDIETLDALCAVYKEHESPLTLWSTVGDWQFIAKNPRNLEFCYKIVDNQRNVILEDTVDTDPIKLNIQQNKFLKLLNRGHNLNTEDLDQLVQLSSSPDTSFINISGQFSSLRGINKFTNTQLSSLILQSPPYTFYGLCSGWTALKNICDDVILTPSTEYRTGWYSNLEFAFPWNTSNVATLLASNVPLNYCSYMFADCSNLVSAGHWHLGLSASYIGSGSMMGMFKNCTSLSAFNNILNICLTGKSGDYNRSYINSYCCKEMFAGCSSMTNISCNIGSGVVYNNSANSRAGAFEGMFKNCTSLNNNDNAITVYVSDPDYYQYKEMFYNCTSLSTAPNISGRNAYVFSTDGYVTNFYPMGNINTGGYQSMFEGCSKITDINLMPFGTHEAVLPSGCAYMFKGCSNLKLGINIGPSTYVDYNPLGDVNVKSLWNLYIQQNGYIGMFQDCISLNVAPMLVGQTVEENGYKLMFAGCTHLYHIVDGSKILSSQNLGAQWTSWLSGASNTGVLHVCCCGNEEGTVWLQRALTGNWGIHFLI